MSAMKTAQLWKAAQLERENMKGGRRHCQPRTLPGHGPSNPPSSTRSYFLIAHSASMN